MGVGGQSEYTPLYEKDIKETQNKSMETTLSAKKADRDVQIIEKNADLNVFKQSGPFDYRPYELQTFSSLVKPWLE